MIPLPAYIDPGSGSLIIQAAIAAIVAVPIFFRTQIARAVRVLRRQNPDDNASGNDATVNR